MSELLTRTTWVMYYLRRHLSHMLSADHRRKPDPGSVTYQKHTDTLAVCCKVCPTASDLNLHRTPPSVLSHSTSILSILTKLAQIQRTEPGIFCIYCPCLAFHGTNVMSCDLTKCLWQRESLPVPPSVHHWTCWSIDAIDVGGGLWVKEHPHECQDQMFLNRRLSSEMVVLMLWLIMYSFNKWSCQWRLPNCLRY